MNVVVEKNPADAVSIFEVLFLLFSKLSIFGSIILFLIRNKEGVSLIWSLE